MPAPRNIVGATIRRLRSNAGLTQPMLAARCGVVGWDVSREILAQIESRFRYVTDWELVVLARALRVNVEELIPAKYKRTGRVPQID